MVKDYGQFFSRGPAWALRRSKWVSMGRWLALQNDFSIANIATIKTGTITTKLRLQGGQWQAGV
jgi:hypothetical protein